MRNLIKLPLLTIIIGLVIFIGSCDSSNEPSLANIDMQMKAISANSTIDAGARTMETGLIFHEILLGVSELEFETLEENEKEDSGEGFDDFDGDGEDDNEKIEYDGQFIVDLINGISEPDFGLANIVPGVYEEIEIKLVPILPDGNSIFISFEYQTTSGDTVQVEYSNNSEFELEIERDLGFDLNEGALNQILVLLDLDLLFDTIDLSQATADTDGVIRINANSNATISIQIETNFKNVFKAGEDNDNDDQFDDDGENNDDDGDNDDNNDDD